MHVYRKLVLQGFTITNEGVAKKMIKNEYKLKANR